MRADFPGLYQDRLSTVGCGDEDKLENIMTFSVLQSHHTSDSLANDKAKFENIFLSDIKKQKETTEIYRQLLDIRNKILSSQPVVAITGPVHCS